MRVTDNTRRALATRRDIRDRTRAGYQCAEVDWRILRGGLYRYRIIDVAIAADGKHVWYRIAPPNDETR